MKHFGLFFASSNEAFVPTYELIQYNDQDFRIVLNKFQRQKGFESRQNSFIPQTEDEEIQRISLSRSKRNIREIALCNEFTHFATLTVDSKSCDRFSLDECQDKLKYTIKEKIRRTNKDFAYIFITEKHKNGAFHFHGLVKNLDFYTNQNGYLSNEVFDKIGFNSFSPIKDFEKTCNYILKYITKDCIKNSHDQIYISSRGLKKAIRYKIDSIDLPWTFENEFCSIFDCKLDDLPKEVLEKLMTIKERGVK